MLIERRSPLTGMINVMDLPVTQEQIDEWLSPSRRMVQDVFPNLSQEQREFIMTGYTNQDWDQMFPEEDCREC